MWAIYEKDLRDIKHLKVQKLKEEEFSEILQDRVI